MHPRAAPLRMAEPPRENWELSSDDVNLVVPMLQPGREGGQGRRRGSEGSSLEAVRWRCIDETMHKRMQAALGGKLRPAGNG